MSISPNIYSSYVNNLPSDAKQRYYKKLQYNNGTLELPDPYNLSTDWLDSPATWPDLTFGDIFIYLIDTPSIYTRETMKAYKSLDAYQYVVSGHVQTVMSHAISNDSPFIALKTKVTPSQRARDKPHEPWVYLSKTTGSVYCAHCTCMAGLGEVCSHVAALLFKVEMGVKMGLTATSSTSRACQWNSAFRKEVIPATVVEICQQIKGKRIKDLDTVQATGSVPMPADDVLKELYSLVPHAAFFTTIAPMVDATPTFSSIADRFPQLLTEAKSDSVLNLNEECTNFMNSYRITDEQSNNLERATRDQSISTLWYQHRNGRITASKAHDVRTMRPSTSPQNLVKRVMGYNSYDLSKKDAVKWGLDHEGECRNIFKSYMQTSHTEFECRLSGFRIHKDHPFLGASPDGITTCKCCGTGTLEIKCPFKHRNVTVSEAASSDSDFCLDASLKLKTSHRYYTQVQFQMFIADVNHCDFVVFTKCEPPSMVIIRITRDNDFCSQLVSKCNTFVKDHIVRELITKELENEPICSVVSDINNNEPETWCLCGQPEYGRMIRCDNEECSFTWFHYRCVNIKRKPRGQWLCDSCA